MSKYPDNPYWCQDHDEPIAILDQRSWDEALAGDHLTAEHVLQRLENMAEYEFGRGAELGLTAEGFYNAIVANGWVLEGNVKLRMWSNEHPPPHVHLEFKDNPKLKLRMSIETGELLDDNAPDGWSKRLKRIAAQVQAQAPQLMEHWAKIEAAAHPSA